MLQCASERKRQHLGDSTRKLPPSDRDLDVRSYRLRFWIFKLKSQGQAVSWRIQLDKRLVVLHLFSIYILLFIDEFNPHNFDFNRL